MKFMIVMLMVVLSAGTLVAETTAKPVPDARDRSLAFLRATGGKIDRPGSMKGFIAVVDAGSGLATTNLELAVKTFRRQTAFDIRVSTAAATEPEAVKKAVGADVAIVVVNNPSKPSLLVAPEDGWALVNVANYRKGLPDGKVGDVLFAARCRKEIVRAFAIACGSFTSQYPGNVLDAPKVEDLDSVSEDVPVDSIQLITTYLKKFGVTPRESAYYVHAVKQGWAPAPTNEYQKAVWDKIHALPTDPIRIKPESQRKK